VCVKSDQLTQDAIISSLLEGCYYSSNGPDLLDFWIEGGTVHVECSPVNRIHFIASDYLNSGFSVWGQSDVDSMTNAQFKLKGDEKYIRVECVDTSGRTAWSNPIYLTND